MTFPPTEQLKALTKKLISPRQRSSLEYNNKLITQSFCYVYRVGAGAAKWVKLCDAAEEQDRISFFTAKTNEPHIERGFIL